MTQTTPQTTTDDDGPSTNIQYLMSLPLIAQGHFANLYQMGEDADGPFKVWVSRMLAIDGETHRVYVNRKGPTGLWYTAQKVHGTLDNDDEYHDAPAT